MQEVILYRSENGLFIFDNTEECQHYDAFGIIEFENLFLEVEDMRFVLLEVKLDEEKQEMHALLQAHEARCSYLMCVNHDELWKITYYYNLKRGNFEMKDGTYDRVYCDMDHESANQTGWFPYWENAFIDGYAQAPESFTEKAFLDYIKESFINYYTAFGHIEQFRQQQTEKPCTKAELYGYLAIKISKYQHRILHLEKLEDTARKILKDELCREDVKRELENITKLLDRNLSLVKLIEEIEDLL